MESEKINRAIEEVLNYETWERESAVDLIKKGESYIIALRRKIEDGIQDGNPIYLCVACNQVLVIRCHKKSDGQHVYYFKHRQDSDDCYLKDNSKLSRNEILARKFNGQSEGEKHKNIKEHLAFWLRADSRFSDVKVESVIKGSGVWSKRHRKPDISANFNGRPVVFEIQISTTFLDIIVERDRFYKDHGVAMFWVFGDFDPSNARAAEKDIFNDNYHNVFSIDESVGISALECGELVFKGFFKKTIFDRFGKALREDWISCSVLFEDIKFNEITGKAYFISDDDLFLINQKEMGIVSSVDQITDLINVETNAIEYAVDLLSCGDDEFASYEGSNNQSTILKSDYQCRCCGQPVVINFQEVQILKSNKKKVFYFEHLPDSDDCITKNNSLLTKEESRWMQLNSEKEQFEYVELKKFVVSILECDVGFSNVIFESAQRNNRAWSKKWKEPDISAVFNGKKIVFEIQLSTNFLDLLEVKGNFYHKKGDLVCWIIKDFNPKKISSVARSVLNRTHNNVFSIDEFSKQKSLNNKQLFLSVKLKEILFNDSGRIVSRFWTDDVVSFDQIKFDEMTGRAYLKSDQDQRVLNDERRILVVCAELEKIVIYEDVDYFDQKRCAIKLKELGLYDSDCFDYKFLNFIKVLLSIKERKIFFPKLDGKWVWLANYVWENYRKYWIVFRCAVKEYGVSSYLDENEKLKVKRDFFQKNWKSDPGLKQDFKYKKLFGFFLPKIRKYIDKFNY